MKDYNRTHVRCKEEKQNTCSGCTLNSKMLDGRVSFKWEQSPADKLWYTNMAVDENTTAAFPYGFNGQRLVDIEPWIPKQSGNGLHFDTSDPSSARLLVYKVDDNNWCGIGCDPSGMLHIRVGLAKDRVKDYMFSTDGHIYCNGNLLV